MHDSPHLDLSGQGILREVSGTDLAQKAGNLIVTGTHHTSPSITECIAAQGLRLTPQRRAVAQAFTQAENLHLSAENVWTIARSQTPDISRATVYNILRILVDTGHLAEVNIGNGPTRYDPNVHRPHHHFLCTKCDSIYDVHLSGIPDLELNTPHQLDYMDIICTGICVHCLDEINGPHAKSRPPASPLPPTETS